MAVHGFILVLLVANSLAQWDSNSEIRSMNFPGRDRAVPTRCTQAGLFCSNCQESYFCNTDNATPIVIACSSTTVCGGTPGSAACIDFTGEGVSAGDCDCDTVGNSGFLADPYDDTRHYICIPSGEQFLITCGDGEVFSTEHNACVQAANSLALRDSNSEIRSMNFPGRDRAVPTRCTQAGLFCSNCQESYLCNTATATPTVFACGSTEVCGGTPGGAGCTDFTGEGVSAGDCDCDTVDNSGFLADPYDATKYFICIPSGGQFLITCDDGEVFSTEQNACVLVVDGPVVDCTVDGVGFHTNDPTCKTYTVCYSDTLPGLPFSCPDGQAYDVSIPGCVSECLLGPSAFACPESGSGAFPDTSDCTIFHICSNGALFAPGSQCPDGQLFEPTSMACVPASTSVVCPVINDCWATYCDACGGTCTEPLSIPNQPGSSTTENLNPDPSPTSSPDIIITTPTGGGTGTPNCSNSPGYFAYAADCKKFWSCQDDDAGGYEAILYRCPGTLYFIPSRSYCSIQSELPTNPGCILTSQ